MSADGGSVLTLRREIMSEAARCVTTQRPLANPLDWDERRPSVKVTQTTPSVKCPVWAGRPRDYQRAAIQALVSDGRHVLPWTWISTSCGQPLCVDLDHLQAHHPVRLAYPWGVCVYCGSVSGTKDHLLPRAWTGEGGDRRRVAVVPSCRGCNAAISDSHAVSVTQRREIAHRWLLRKHRALLAVPDRTPDQLREYGTVLRSVIEANIRKRADVRLMLAWPEDPDYDLRAFERSGIEDPYGLGLL